MAKELTPERKRANELYENIALRRADMRISYAGANAELKKMGEAFDEVNTMFGELAQIIKKLDK